MRRGSVVVLVALAGAASGSKAGKGAFTGTFVGDVDVGGGFLIVRPDEGSSDLIGREPVKPGRVTVTTADGKAYAVAL